MSHAFQLVINTLQYAFIKQYLDSRVLRAKVPRKKAATYLCKTLKAAWLKLCKGLLRAGIWRSRGKLSWTIFSSLNRYSFPTSVFDPQSLWLPGKIPFGIYKQLPFILPMQKLCLLTDSTPAHPYSRGFSAFQPPTYLIFPTLYLVNPPWFMVFFITVKTHGAVTTLRCGIRVTLICFWALGIHGSRINCLLAPLSKKHAFGSIAFS